MVVMRVPHISDPGAAAARPLRLARVSARFPARDRRAARHLLHLDVHRPGGQAVSRGSDVGDAASLFLFPDAAVCLLRHPDGRAGLHAGHHRRDDEEQRTARDARLWHQPVPDGGAAPVVRGAGQRALFTMQEQVLATANREADRLERIIRHWPPATSALEPSLGASEARARSTTTTCSIRMRTGSPTSGSTDSMTAPGGLRGRHARSRGDRGGPYDRGD